VIGLDQPGAIVLRKKGLRGQIEARFANMPPCVIGMEACVGAHHLPGAAGVKCSVSFDFRSGSIASV
jgi:transposase